MTLLELCEPLFQYICNLNRLARAGGDRAASRVRADIKAELDAIRARVAQTPGLLNQFQITEGRDGKRGIELVLIFFADEMIRNSRLPWAGSWDNIAEEHDEFAGQNQFYVLLDETLEDRSPEATERLAVFYTCMGLGFEGDPITRDYQQYLNECASRIRNYMDANDAERICKEAYEQTDTRPLHMPVGGRILNRVLLFLGILIVVYVVSALAYNNAVSDLSRSLAAVAEATETARATGDGE